MLKREVVKETFCNTVISSDLKEVTVEEVVEAKETFQRSGYCDHSLVEDVPGWLYDIRSCAICGKGLGAI